MFWLKALFAENASDHIALGNAYPYTVKGFEGKSDDELIGKCVN